MIKISTVNWSLSTKRSTLHLVVQLHYQHSRSWTFRTSTPFTRFQCLPRRVFHTSCLSRSSTRATQLSPVCSISSSTVLSSTSTTVCTKVEREAPSQLATESRIPVTSTLCKKSTIFETHVFGQIQYHSWVRRLVPIPVRLLHELAALVKSSPAS